MHYKNVITLLILVGCLLVISAALKTPQNKTVRAKTKKKQQTMNVHKKILPLKDEAGVCDQLDPGKKLPAKTKDKDALMVKEDTGSDKIWSFLKWTWNWIKADLSKAIWDDDEGSKLAVKQVAEQRTFGRIRRMQMALIPLVFKFGFLYAMVAFLILLGMKTLFLVKMMVFLNGATLLGKLFSLKLPNFMQQNTEPYPVWSGPLPYEQHPSAHASVNGYQPNKEIHVHLHGGTPPGASQVTSYSLDASNANGGWHHRNDPFVGLSTAYSGVHTYGDVSQPLDQKISYSG